MYVLSKSIVTRFIRGECERRLRIDLVRKEGDKRNQGMPAKGSQRPGLALIAKEGRRFEREKFAELARSFPGRVRHGEPMGEGGEDSAFQPLPLSECMDALRDIGPGGDVFLVEAEYAVPDAFADAHGLGNLVRGGAFRQTGSRRPDPTAATASLEFAKVRPDIIHAVPAGDGPREAMTPAGTVYQVPAGDRRTGLRIADVKLASEPSPGHFAELAYYGMTLAARLAQDGRDRDFVVLKDAAIWPGRHGASSLHRVDQDGDASHDALVAAFAADLETMPAEAVLGRVRRFLSHDLRRVISAPDWRRLPWHVDSSCIGCDYLGYEWKKTSDDPEERAVAQARHDKDRHEATCWALAERTGHLSRIAGLTRGACGRLRENGVRDVAGLAALGPGNRVFDEHHKLAAGRTLYKARSEALASNGTATLADRTGTSAVLPRFCDIDVAMTVDYDVGSDVTFALGYQVLYRTPGEDGKNRVERKPPRVMLVERKDLKAERRVVVEAMRILVSEVIGIAAAIEAAHAAHDTPRKGKMATFQVHLWDRLSLDHLREVTGRHLDALLAPPEDGGTTPAPMAWLFPSVFVLEDERFVATGAPVTVVSDAVGSMLAADIPHRYSLLAVANAYHTPFHDRQDGKPPFRVGALFHDPLSDQIPSERGHEMWNDDSPLGDVDWQEHREALRRTVGTRLRALHAVVERLRADLGDTLKARAPAVRATLFPPEPLGAVAPDARVWFRHTKLMAAAVALENDVLLAMPPHQREATFASARFGRRLTGADASAALQALDRADMDGKDTTYVFEVEPRSRQAKVKPGGGNWSLMPQAMLGLQDERLDKLKAAHPDLGPKRPGDERRLLRDSCKASVEAVDRTAGLVALKADRLVVNMEKVGLFDFDLDPARGSYAVLDPLPMDVFTRRFRNVAKAIGVPPLSISQPLFRGRDLSMAVRAGVRRTRSLPVERFIWDAGLLSTESVPSRAGAVLRRADPHGTELNDSQRRAVEKGATRRLSLLWGPPGTGKSKTSARLLLGLVAEALDRGVGLRIAVTGPTWVAVDTVMSRLPDLLEKANLSGRVQLARLEGSMGGNPPPDALKPYLVRQGTEAFRKLKERMADRGATIVGGTVYRLNDLASDSLGYNKGITLVLSYDHILVDEASQMPVTQAIVGMSGLAEGGCVTVVGDDLQMPPIQALPPPKGTEHLLGSIYDFYLHYRSGEGAKGEGSPVEPTMLATNFRSNAEVVDFVRGAGYRDDLRAHFADMRMRLSSAVPTARPPDWPADLPWDPVYARILDPEAPLVAVVHGDDAASQRSVGEADLAAALARLLQGRLLPDPDDDQVPQDVPHGDARLFAKGLGVVTPHRAQQAAVLDRLRPLVTGKEALRAMASSVDTVERFQGQERTAMIASLGVGDRDQVAAEEEFLYSLNRFNVIVSRAKSKMVVLVARRVVDHLPSDPVAMRQSRLLKSFAQPGGKRASVHCNLRGLGECEVVFP